MIYYLYGSFKTQLLIFCLYLLCQTATWHFHACMEYANVKFPI